MVQRASEIAASKGKDNWRLVRDLLRVDLKQVLADAKRKDPDMSKFGFIPYMAKTSLGRLLAESFAERIFRNCNSVPTSGNMRLNPIEMVQLVVLRMNKRFVQYMKKHHRGEIVTALGMDCTSFKDAEVVDEVDADDVDPADITLAAVVFS